MTEADKKRIELIERAHAQAKLIKTLFKLRRWSGAECGDAPDSPQQDARLEREHQRLRKMLEAIDKVEM